MKNMIKHFPISATDAYKISHMLLFPEDVTKVYSVLTPRKNSYFPWDDHMTSFGYQLFVKKVLLESFQENFFDQSAEDVEYTYYRIISSVMGKDVADRTLPHIMELHKLGYLPVKINAIKEGLQIPMGTPALTIENTHPNFAWIGGFLETILLSETFVTSTVASVARKFKQSAIKWGNKTADNLGYLPFQIHDFSQRGQHGSEASFLSGIAHLTSFQGTDNLTAPYWIERYYNKGDESLDNAGSLGASVVATEHSVMETLGQNQLGAYKYLIENNPKGILSIVSDTYNYWEVIDEVLPALKDSIMARDGKLVVRPDSLEEPVKELVITLQHLWSTFGGTVNSKGYKVLDSHIGVLHGEGITLDNIDDFFSEIEKAGFSTENIVLGVGAYVYSVNVSRDSFAQALKAQLVQRTDSEGNVSESHIFKAPKDTMYPDSAENKLKKSHKGAVAVNVDSRGELVPTFDLDLKTANKMLSQPDSALQTIFENGKVVYEQSFTEIRNNIDNNL